MKTKSLESKMSKRVSVLAIVLLFSVFNVSAWGGFLDDQDHDSGETKTTYSSWSPTIGCDGPVQVFADEEFYDGTGDGDSVKGVINSGVAISTLPLHYVGCSIVSVLSL